MGGQGSLGTVFSTVSTHIARCCLLSGSRAYGCMGQADSHEEEGLMPLFLLKWRWQAGCPRAQVPAHQGENSSSGDPME